MEGGGRGTTQRREERMPSNAMLSKGVQQYKSFCTKTSSTNQENIKYPSNQTMPASLQLHKIHCGIIHF